MRPGGSHAKGAAWERDVGKWLSLWITHGDRQDLFSRNVLSGGRFTLAETKGGTAGIPGDLMPAHPLAFQFLMKTMVECKHIADINLLNYAIDQDGTTLLSRFMDKARSQAARHDLDAWLIAKQDRKPPLLFSGITVGQRLLNSMMHRDATRFATFHSGHVYMFPFFALLENTDATTYLEAIR